jgi:hypothetical protein
MEVAKSIPMDSVIVPSFEEHSAVMASPRDPTKAQRDPTPERQRKLKKQPDYILALLYCLVYLEFGWLIVMIWRSCY